MTTNGTNVAFVDRAGNVVCGGDTVRLVGKETPHAVSDERDGFIRIRISPGHYAKLSPARFKASEWLKCTSTTATH